MKEFCMSVSCDKQSLKKDTACARTDSFDFHRIAVTSIKISFKRLKPSAMKDGDYYSSKKIILRIIIIWITKSNFREKCKCCGRVYRNMLEKILIP